MPRRARAPVPGLSGQTAFNLMVHTTRRVSLFGGGSFKSLPTSEYPTVAELADYLTEDAQDELFKFGIDMCLRGIEALAKRGP